MQFRPCIDIHDGKVKQIIGSSLSDYFLAQENFVSNKDAAYFAGLYKSDNLYGGHVIMLDQSLKTKKQGILALKTFPGGLQIGGGINPGNAGDFLEAGASHVIVTSYIFEDGKLNLKKLSDVVALIGKNRLVLDLSCRKQGSLYYVVTNRWQKFTDFEISQKNLEFLATYCDEFLVHGVEAEGKQTGVEEEILELLSKFTKIPVTYAGGIRDIADIEKIKQIGNEKIDFTIGSALDLFGGKIKYKEIIKKYAD